MTEKTKLCYCDAGVAYFTTVRDLKDQWGDDWNDAPYEHNAGKPYDPCWHNWPEYRDQHRASCLAGELCDCVACRKSWTRDGEPKWEIFTAPYDEERWLTPDCGHFNSPWSVQDINDRRVPWLSGVADDTHIWAGTTMPEFLMIVRSIVSIKF